MKWRHIGVAVFSAALTSSFPVQSASPPAVQTDTSATTLPIRLTEEGQHVAFDRITWQRRELAKRLPLDESWPTEAQFPEMLGRFNLSEPDVPKTLPVPAAILPGIFLVNSTPNHTYLIDAGPHSLILIDPGLTENVSSILENVHKLGYSDGDIRWVINTHAHFDHSMADEAFRKRGAKIMIGEADAAAVERGTLATANYMLPKAERESYPLTKVDWRISDGEELHLGNRTLLAIHTPGHTAGSTSFLLQADRRNILFGGDTVLYDGRLGLQDTAYADNAAYEASLRKLAHFTLDRIHRLRWDVLLPGHGALVLDRASLDVEKAWRTVELARLDGEPVKPHPYSYEHYRLLMFGRP